MQRTRKTYTGMVGALPGHQTGAFSITVLGASDGKPWSERKKLVWWDEEKKEWTGLDVPDFYKDRPPDYKPPEEPSVMRQLRATNRHSSS